MGKVYEVIDDFSGLTMYIWWEGEKLKYSWCNPLWFQ